jgi:sporulation protein YlmC with PRC-barrel domain
VDLDAAEKIGEIQEIILDPGAARVAGLAVSGGGGFIGTPKQVLVPASSVHAVGPDAVMVHRPVVEEAPSYLGALPRVSDLAGRRLVSDAGRLVGSVCDVLFDSHDGRLIGYEFRPPNAPGGLAALGIGRTRPAHYVRAEANLRIGANIIVIPDDAVVHSPAEELDDETEVVTGRWQGTDLDSGRTRQFLIEEQRLAS